MHAALAATTKKADLNLRTFTKQYAVPLSDITGIDVVKQALNLANYWSTLKDILLRTDPTRRGLPWFMFNENYRNLNAT